MNFWLKYHVSFQCVYFRNFPYTSLRPSNTAEMLHFFLGGGGQIRWKGNDFAVFCTVMIYKMLYLFLIFITNHTS